MDSTAQPPPNDATGASTDASTAVSSGDAVAMPGADRPPTAFERQRQAMRDLMRSYEVDYVLASSQQAKWGVLALVSAEPAELRWLRTLPTAGIFAPVRQAARSE